MWVHGVSRANILYELAVVFDHKSTDSFLHWPVLKEYRLYIQYQKIMFIILNHQLLLINYLQVLDPGMQ